MKRAVLVLALLALALLSVPATMAVTEHCPDGGTKVESQVDGDLDDIVLDAGTLFCVKGSTDATGILTADGETTLAEYLGNDHNVSYYVTYPAEEPTATATATLPTDEPTATPTDEPTATPTDAPTDAPTDVPTERPVTPTETPPSTDTGAEPTGVSHVLSLVLLFLVASMVGLLVLSPRR